MSALTDANREHFNEHADTYDSKPWMKTISQQIGTALLERKEWSGVRWYEPGEVGGRSVKLLDYACGTGSITRALGPLVTRIIGIDISEKMVHKYNEEAQSMGLSTEQVHAVVGNLLGEEVDEALKGPEFWDFDVAVVGLGFHHFEDPLKALQRLTERLKPGRGVLMIIDFLPFETPSTNPADANRSARSETIKHAGFTRANLERLHQAAKLERFSFSVVDEPAVMELQEGTQKRKLFITRAVREPTAWGKFANWVSALQMEAGRQTSIAARQQDRDEVPEQLGIVGQTRPTGKQPDRWDVAKKGQ